MPILYKITTTDEGKPRYSTLDFCHSCKSRNIVLNKTPVGTNSFRIRYGQWQCLSCYATVAAHRDGKPQGYMAGTRIRKLRYEYHSIMARLLLQKYTYEDICSYIQVRLCIDDADHVHGAWLKAEELIAAIEVMTERYNRPKKNRPYNKERAYTSDERPKRQVKHKRSFYDKGGKKNAR